MVLKELVLISSKLCSATTSYCNRVGNRHKAGKDNYKKYYPISTKRVNY